MSDFSNMKIFATMDNTGLFGFGIEPNVFLKQMLENSAREKGQEYLEVNMTESEFKKMKEIFYNGDYKGAAKYLLIVKEKQYEN